MLTDGSYQCYTLWKDLENLGDAGKTMLKMIYSQLKIDISAENAKIREL